MRLKRMDGKGQKAAAAAAGMSERSARTWQEGALPSATRSARDWRTRRDPFGGVWEAELVPLLKTDDKRVLQATTLIELLQERHPGQFIGGQARTLQRRMRDWRAVNGPTQEVFSSRPTWRVARRPSISRTRRSWVSPSAERFSSTCCSSSC
jgi:hypothetical protein